MLLSTAFLKFLEFSFVFGNHCRIDCFSWRVTTSFPGITKLEQFDSDRVAFDLNAEFCLDFLGELAAIPSSIFKQFLLEEGCDFCCDFGRLTWGLPVSKSFDAVLLESSQVILYRASAAFEVLNKPVDAVAFAVESEDAGSESDFGVDTGVVFEAGKLGVLVFGQREVAVRATHFSRIHSGNT
jgi:hypothetical protein